MMIFSEHAYSTYTIASWDSPDICPHPPSGLGVYIRQIPPGHGITNKFNIVESLVAIA